MSQQPRRKQSQNQSAIDKLGQVSPRVGNGNRLFCEEGKDHDTGMRWQVIGGLRTGHMIAWCWTCQRVVPEKPCKPPKEPSRRAYHKDYHQLYRQRRGADNGDP